MVVTALLYQQYLQTITPPVSKPTTPKAIEIPLNNPLQHPSTETSPLLSLPFELRSQIYSHTLSLHRSEELKRPTHSTTPLFADGVCTSLLLVNRQIYHEARLLPFQVNNFIFTKCFGSSVYSAHRFLAKLEAWQRRALRSVEIAVVGREISEKRRREEGWDVVVSLLSDCKRVDVRVWIQEGDEWVGRFNGDMHGWVANGGGDDFPGPLNTKRGNVMPVISKGRGGWVQTLLEGGEMGDGVRLEFCWLGIDDGAKRVMSARDWNAELS